MTDQNQEQEKISRILIVFEYPGSAQFKVQVENVYPNQILALASYLELEAKQNILEQRILMQQQAQNNQPKIIVPEGRLVKS